MAHIVLCKVGEVGARAEDVPAPNAVTPSSAVSTYFMEEYLPQYAQLLGLGFLWVTVHCSGMCGPVAGSLVASRGDETTGLKRLRGRIGRVLAYQGGRAVTYALLGAGAGAAGAAVESAVGGVARIAGLIIATVLVIGGLLRVEPIARRIGLTKNSSSTTGRFLGSAMRRVRRLAPNNTLVQMATFGLLLGLLPCMLMFWVLGLSASTASPLHGALIMVGLVIMTTPILLLAGTASLLCKPALRRFGEKLVPFAVIFSGLWLGMMATAANGWIPHAHVPFEVFGEKLVIMFW